MLGWLNPLAPGRMVVAKIQVGGQKVARRWPEGGQKVLWPAAMHQRGGGVIVR
jgi:hypothetical protein